MKRCLIGLVFWCSIAVAGMAQTTTQTSSNTEASELTVMAWNIWRGGREDGEDIGPARVIDVIRDSDVDIVAMQETYGSGELIADALGYHLHSRGTNVSIHSRFSIFEDISVHAAFKCVGAILELPDGSRLAFYSIWLPYSGEIWEAGTRDSSQPRKMLAACEASAIDLNAMWSAIEARLSATAYVDVPIIIAGDFNSMSHLDYGEVGWDQYHAVVDWPTSHILTQQGFVDTYRVLNPVIDRARDATWTPRFPTQEQDRIDFIYARAPAWRVAASHVIRQHAIQFPSDHTAVVTTLERSPTSVSTDHGIRAASYNIRHGAGMDGRIDLDRTAAVLASLNADIIGLQEVDLRATRSGGVNQVNVLAQRLGMHPAYGSFMDFQGGRYGMAMLSRYPIVKVTPLRLPNGNEPRIALCVDVRLPDGQVVQVVNVHFDWVEDDAFRFAQAKIVTAHVRDHNGPCILLGDFNDQPGSRTMRLFDGIAGEADKPAEQRLTFPSDDPSIEIDFVYCTPAARWAVGSVAVIDEAVASDHRPVVVDLTLRPAE
ncbi:MAG: endonuclease/exonuclease/phosphatase family protein [Planctomycetota bacterium]